MEEILKSNDSMILATAKLQKKQKVQQGGSPYFETVAMRLLDVQQDLRKNYDDASLAVVEIEVTLEISP
jgi:hypothetical protein